MQQPPLSQQIRALEAELGVELLKRHPKGVALTAAGKMYARDAQAILGQVERAGANAQRFADGIEGSLTIGCSASAAAHSFVPTLIRTFRDRFPAVAMEFRESNAAELTESVGKGVVQVAILRAPVAHPEGIAYVRLVDEPMLAILPLPHKLVVHGRKGHGFAPIALRSLRTEGFILVRRPNAPGMYADLVKACARVGFTPRIVAEVNRMLINVSLVAAGFGVSVVPSSVLGFHPHRVAYCPLRDAPELVAPLTLAWRTSEADPAAGRFVAVAKELAAMRSIAKRH